MPFFDGRIHLKFAAVHADIQQKPFVPLLTALIACSKPLPSLSTTLPQTTTGIINELQKRREDYLQWLYESRPKHSTFKTTQGPEKNITMAAGCTHSGHAGQFKRIRGQADCVSTMVIQQSYPIPPEGGEPGRQHKRSGWY